MGEFPSRENQFKRGSPGGPGRPRMKSILDVARERLAEVKGDDRSLAETIFDDWLAMIAEGGPNGLAALKELLNRMHGKNPLKIEGELEVTATHHDDDLPDILAALGYEQRIERGAEAVGGPMEPGRIGGGREPGQVADGAAPQIAERQADPIRTGHPRPEEPAVSHLHAAAARQE